MYCRVQFNSLLKGGWSDLLNGLSKLCVIYRLLSGMQEMLTSAFFIIVLLTRVPAVQKSKGSAAKMVLVMLP